MVDVETTGVDLRRDRIVEIAVITVDGAGTAADRWETLVRPEDPASSPVSGIRREMLATAPTFAEIAGDAISRLAAGVVAGHNVMFDLRVLDVELRRLGHQLPTLAYLCTRELAYLLGLDVPNHSLAALCHYFGIDQPRWHTASDDATATAAVLGRLVALAASYGRTDLAGLCGYWWAHGPSAGWPALAPSGRVLVRNVERFPPGGIQPTSPKALRSSWRGAAIGDTSAASVTIGPETFGVDLDDLILQAVARRWSDNDIAGWDPALRALVVRARGDDEDARAARHQLRVLVDQADSADHGEEEVAETPEERWWRGGFKGLAGIAELERVIDDFRARDVPELTEALLEQANLLARHGGRGDEVRARLDEAFSVSLARAHATGEWEGFTGVVDQTWSWLQDRRDVDGQVGLARRCLDQAPECPWSEFDTPVVRLVGSVHDYRGREPRVGERLAVAAATLLRERGDRDGAWAVEAALVWLLDTDGRVEEASAVCEAAWSQGCTQPDLLDRLSLRLERAKQFDRAAEVCRHALAAGAGSHTDTLAKRQARCAIKAAKRARPEA